MEDHILLNLRLIAIGNIKAFEFAEESPFPNASEAFKGIYSQN